MKGPMHGPFDHRFNIKSLMRRENIPSHISQYIDHLLHPKFVIRGTFNIAET